MSDERKEPDTSQAGTTYGYRIEAMVDSDEPLTVDGQTFTRKWRVVHFNEGAVGVPVGSRFEMWWMVATHVYSYQSAQALRWWLHANANASRDIPMSFNALALKTRLVKYEIKFDVRAVRQSEHAEVCARDRETV